MIPYGHQDIDEEDIKEVIKVLKSDWITQGEKVDEFEKKFADYVGAKYAVAVNSGTAALHSACFAAGITEGDAVITSPITFVASVNCIIYQDGTPIFVDVDKDTLNIDYNKIALKLAENEYWKFKAIIPVDFTGRPADLEAINKIAKENNIVVIEDACHALGAIYNGKKVGSISDMTVFSFHPVKHITTGEGGMITTNSKEYYERLKLFRTHGITKDKNKMLKCDGSWYYEMQELGYNYRITDFQCALGISQLRKIDRFIQKRIMIVYKYQNAFRNIPEIIIPNYYPIKSVPSWHLYIIQLNLERLNVGRMEIFNELREKGLGVNVHYIPVYLQPYYQDKFCYEYGDFPIAESYYKRAITLPLYPKMTDKEVQYVIDTVKEVISHHSK